MMLGNLCRRYTGFIELALDKRKTCNWYVYMSTPAKNSGVADTVDDKNR